MHSAMTRPLFEEPSADCERDDPWSGPKGFMFGGWSLPSGTSWEMAEQYYLAASLLIKDILDDRMEDYKLGTPVLFLYRHWLELAAKGLLPPMRGHDLAKLAAELRNNFAKRGVTVPEWILLRFREMASIDSKSTAFRYAGDTVAGEIYVSLPHLRDAMRWLRVALATAKQNGTFPTEFTLANMKEDPTE